MNLTTEGENLSLESNLEVTGNIKASGNLNVGGNTTLGGFQTNITSTDGTLAMFGSTCQPITAPTLQVTGSTENPIIKTSVRALSRGTGAPYLPANDAYYSWVVGQMAVNRAPTGTHEMVGSFGVKGAIVYGAGNSVIQTGATFYVDGETIISGGAAIVGRNDAFRVRGKSYFNGDVELVNPSQLKSHLGVGKVENYSLAEIHTAEQELKNKHLDFSAAGGNTATHLPISAFDSNDLIELDQTPVFIKAMRALGSPIQAETFATTYFQSGSALPLSDGSVRYHAIYLPQDTLLSGTIFQCTGVQANYTADNTNQTALFAYEKSTGNLSLVASSQNNGNLWKAAPNALSQEPYTTAYAAKEGLYFLAILWNASSVTQAPSLLGNIGDSDYRSSLLFSNSVGWAMHGNAVGGAIPTSTNVSALSINTQRIWLAVY